MATITSPRNQSPAPPLRSPSVLSEAATSSIRGSLDLNNRPNGARRGNRAALRDYYQIKAKPTPPHSNLVRTDSISSVSSGGTTNSQATLQHDADLSTSALTAPLDEDGFEVKSWLDGLLQKGSLRDVLRTEATLVSEIRNLDGERKALVYNNYSKLITAVGTLGELQQGIRHDAGLKTLDGLQEQVAGLSATVAKIANAAAARSGTVSHEADVRRRDRVDRKSRDAARNLLDAPRRIQTMLDGGNTDAAEREWASTQAQLERWKGIEGVSEVEDACQRIMQSRTEEAAQAER